MDGRMIRIGKITFKGRYVPMNKSIYPTVYENGYERAAIFEFVYAGVDRVIYRRVA
jgi:hypothetical protein